MAGQSSVDNVLKMFMHGVDSVHFPLSLQDSLANLLKNADSADNLVDDISEWRRGVLKQSDLSAQARSFLENPTTIVRIKSIPKVQEISTGFVKAVESNANNIDVDGFMRQILDKTNLPKDDLARLRSSFDDLVKAREETIQKILDDYPKTKRQDVLDQLQAEFANKSASRASRASRGAHSGGYSDAESLRDDLNKLKSKMDAPGGLSTMDEFYVRMKRRMATTSLVLLGVAVGDAAMGSPLGEALGRASQKKIPMISYVASKLSGTLALAVDGIAFVLSAPAEMLASTVIGGMEENGKIAKGEVGNDQRALVKAITHVAMGNTLPAAKVVFGIGLSAQDINDAVVRAQADSISSEETVFRVFEELKHTVADNTRENGYGLAGSTLDLDKKAVEEKKEEISTAANRHFFNGLSGLFSNRVSSVFNIASDNLDKLGIGGVGKGVFQFLGMVAGIVGIFSNEAKKSIQSFALSAFGVDEKISALKTAVANNRTESQFGNRFPLSVQRKPVLELATADL